MSSIKHRHLLRIGIDGNRMPTLVPLVLVATLLVFNSPAADANFTCPDPSDDIKAQAGEALVHHLSPYVVAVTCSWYEARADYTQGYLFADGHPVQVVRCIEGTWLPVGSTCFWTARLQCNDNPPEVAGATSGDPELLGHTVVDPLEMAKAYKCNPGTSFASGEPARVSFCKDGHYTPIYDHCSEDCTMPKDCSEVLNPANASGRYQVSPFQTLELRITVFCMNFSGDGAWTLISRFSKALENVYATEKLRAGYGALHENYFIGMEYMMAIGQTVDWQPRPLMVLIVVEDESHMHYHGTYEDVVIDPETFKFTIRGGFYGTAGSCWGNNGSFLINETYQDKCNILNEPPMWHPIRNIASITMYVRPMEYDQEVACPVFPLYVPTTGRKANTQFAHLPIDRLENATIMFHCNEMFKEENSFAQYGNATCVKGEDGTLNWDKEILLPCILHCPDPFFKTTRETHCLHMTEVGEPFGVHSASLSCGKLNSSLVLLTRPKELAEVPEGNFYYTAHYAVTPDNVIMKPRDFRYNCSDSDNCEASESNKCFSVTQDLYRMDPCNDTSTRAMCRLPALCPGGFVEYRGLCYSLNCNEGAGNLTSRLMACKDNGSALAYPETIDVLVFILMGAKAQSTALTHVDLGINDFDGSWTNGELYTPDENMLYMMGTSEGGNFWRKMALDESLGIEPRELEAEEKSCFVCQYLARPDCWSDPPEPTVNMSREWDGTLELGVSVNFSCYPGYFINGDLNLTSLNTTCIGQLGNWYSDPVITDCIAVDVCLELPDLPTLDMIVTKTESSHLLNGSIEFTCPGNTMMENGLTVQNITCIEMDEAYTFDLMTLEECHEACQIAPTVVNATTDWNETAIYIKGSNVNATCDPGKQFSFGETSMNLNCEAEDQWQTLSCYPVCEGDPPTPGENMNMSTPFVNNSIGTVLTYTCTDGFYTVINETFPDPKNETLVECGSDATWVVKGPLTCIEMCLDDPPSGEPPFTSSWDGISRALDTEVEISCDGLYLLGDESQNQKITCTDGNWTSVESHAPVESHVPVCITGTYNPPSHTAPENISAVLEGPDPPFLEGDQMNYTCEGDKLAYMGVAYYTVTFTADGWTEVDPNFFCYDVSEEDPIINVTSGMPGILDMPPTPYYVGITCNYTCPGDTMTPTSEKTTQLTYMPDGWSPLPPHFICLNVSYMPPVIPAEAFSGGTLIGAVAPFYVGQKLPYSCLPGYMSTKLDEDGNNIDVTYVTYLGEEKWSDLDPEFVCVPVHFTQRERIAPSQLQLNGDIPFGVTKLFVKLICSFESGSFSKAQPLTILVILFLMYS